MYSFWLAFSITGVSVTSEPLGRADSGTYKDIYESFYPKSKVPPSFICLLLMDPFPYPATFFIELDLGPLLFDFAFVLNRPNMFFLTFVVSCLSDKILYSYKRFVFMASKLLRSFHLNSGSYSNFFILSMILV